MVDLSGKEVETSSNDFDTWSHPVLCVIFLLAEASGICTFSVSSSACSAACRSLIEARLTILHLPQCGQGVNFPDDHIDTQ